LDNALHIAVMESKLSVKIRSAINDSLQTRHKYITTGPRATNTMIQKRHI